MNTSKDLGIKKYSIYQIILAYLYGRYAAYREEGFLADMSFDDFVRMVCKS